MTVCDRCSAKSATEIKRTSDGDAILSLCQHHTDQFGPELHKYLPWKWSCAATSKAEPASE